MFLSSRSTRYAPAIFAVLLVLFVAPLASADVLLSELCDPRNDYLTDRYIEIWNSGPATVDLTGWQIVALGNTNEIFTWNLSGTIAPGQALVAGDDNTVDSFPVDFAAGLWSDNDSTWNGKIGDGARLRNGSGTVIDEVYAAGTLFENQTLVRNEGVTTPTASFNAAEWTATPVYTPSEATPGVHWTTAGDGPVIGTIVTIPASPEAGQVVDVQAVVTDGTATITGVSLDWGTVSGSLGTTIAMTNTGGDTWETVTPIPAQSGGTVVYYQITASNDVPADTVSDELSYELPIVLTIQQIQGTGASSPYVGQTVYTSGVVTATMGIYDVIQDGTGARSGVWVENSASAGLGHVVEGFATVTETDGNTVLVGTLNVTGTASLPTPEALSTAMAGDEDWEGVFVQVQNATCTLDNEPGQSWLVNDGSGSLVVDDAVVEPALNLGSIYTIYGVMSGFSGAQAGLVPRIVTDFVLESDPAAPAVASVVATGPTVVEVTFSEPVTAVTAQVVGNYSVSGSTVSAAAMIAGTDNQVRLTVSTMAPGAKTLIVDAVEDAYGNALSNVSFGFNYSGGNIPAGYYDTAEGLTGEILRGALHNIIDNHTVISYAGVYDAFYTTDDKPNGKVWDMYSDVPGGTPPYEYTFGVDEGGDPSAEGTGYNREHSWPSSWYGGSGVPYTDVFLLVPTDNRVNNMRGSYPYGETDAPTWTSLNGSKRGPCSYPGYTGVVFEPIDEYKGDFARAYFYVATRYYTEDSSWSANGMVDGSQLLPWAEAMLLEWAANDPVSTKEIDRNEAAYAIQGNRNPFIDRPDFLLAIYQPWISPVEDVVLPAAASVLYQNAPNPFNPSTTIRYELGTNGPVELRVFDLSGRLIRTLFNGVEAAGVQQKTWLGRDQQGRSVASGVYFYRLQTDGEVQTKRMLLAK